MSANVDYGEIHKFDEMASRWWDPEGEFKPLHQINPLRLGYIRARAELEGRRVVDVGCGGGILTESLALSGGQVIGLDMGEGPLSVARLHQLETGVEVDYRQCTAETMAAEAPHQFDVVTCMEMLEHVPNPDSVVAACAALCRPGGQVFFSTINRNPKSWLMAVVGAEYVLRMLPTGTHTYQRFIKPSELSVWCRAAGLEVEHITGLHYNPLSRRYWLGPGVEVNYLVHCRLSDTGTGIGLQ
jgi:2-polyprenyl-6-hydroxyphenyl methylase/3-demethylubiquinone-9 3-methyltransferase